jgi:hypothetical protein
MKNIPIILVTTWLNMLTYDDPFIQKKALNNILVTFGSVKSAMAYLCDKRGDNQ